MIRTTKRTRCRRQGFTLVETICVLAICSIIFVCLMTIFNGAVTMTADGEHTAQAQAMAKSASEMLETVLRYANTMDLETTLPGNVSSKYNYVYLENGQLLQRYWGGTPELLMDAEALNGYSYDVAFRKSGLDVMSLTVSVLYRDEPLCTLTSDIYLANLMDASITGVDVGKCLCYQGTGITVERISIFAPSSILWQSGISVYLTAVTYPRNASTPGVAWSVSDESIATIDQTGLLTPLRNGTIVVRATALDGSTTYKTKTITIINQ